MGKVTDAVLADVDRLIQVWEDNPDFTLGDLTLPNVKAKRETLRARNQLVDEARTDLSRLIDEASDIRGEVEQIVTRGRSGIRASFSPDSPQYAQVGGTRASERKPRSKTKAAGGKPTT